MVLARRVLTPPRPLLCSNLAPPGVIKKFPVGIVQRKFLPLSLLQVCPAATMSTCRLCVSFWTEGTVLLGRKVLSTTRRPTRPQTRLQTGVLSPPPTNSLTGRLPGLRAPLAHL